jgi:hypothetical protein
MGVGDKMTEEQALALAQRHLEEEGMGNLGHHNSVFLEKGELLSPHPDRDLWVVSFKRRPTGTDLDYVHPDTVVVVIDCVSSAVWSRSLL